MAVDFKRPAVPRPLRVVILGAATEGWYQASLADRRDRILPRIQSMFAEWRNMGAQVLATVDDDLFMVGQPTGPGWSWYLVYDVPDADTVAAMIDAARAEVDGVRLDRCIRLEARIGRPFFLLEPQTDG
jgi:hypothetical protein